MKWSMMLVGLSAIGLHEWLATVGNMGSLAAGAFLTIAGMVATSGVVIALTVMTSPPEKVKAN
jgi:hypothetical protein